MCIFCKIVNGEIPSYKIYETTNTLAFLDISQNTRGHTLVIPKKHVDNLFDLPKDICGELMESIVTVSNILKVKLPVNDLNVLNNCGKLAGQVVEHVHFHLIPRYGNDECYFKESPHEPDFDKLTQLYNHIVK